MIAFLDASALIYLLDGDAAWAHWEITIKPVWIASMPFVKADLVWVELTALLLAAWIRHRDAHW